MPGGRPTEYKEEYVNKVDEYLESNQDIDTIEFEVDGEAVSKPIKLKVKLPTVEGFALFIDVSKRVLYDWEKEYPEFLHALDKIRTEQQQRLLDKGLSGDYNPTIAKLILSSNHGMREKSDVTSDDKPIAGNTIIFKDFAEDETE